MPTFRWKFFSIFIFTCGILVKYRQEMKMFVDLVTQFFYLFAIITFFIFLKKKIRKRKVFCLENPMNAICHKMWIKIKQNA